MKRWNDLALYGIAVIVAASTFAAFTESYRALLDWASTHSLTQFFAWIWPLQIDVFIAVGELALFVATIHAWPKRSRVWAWVITGVGLAVSVAANVGHVTGQPHLLTNRLTAAVPPLAAAASLTVAMVILKWVTQQQERAEYQPRHSAELAALTSDAKRIMYAADITGSREPRELVAWLHEQGHPVSPENVRTVVRRQLALSNGHQEPPNV